MKYQALLAASLLFVLPIVIFWGCNSSSRPVSAVGSSTVSVTVPLRNANGEILGANSNTFYYCFSGSGSSAPITGSVGPIAGASSSFTFNVNLGGAYANYNLLSLEVTDSSSGQVLGVGCSPIGGSSSVPVTLGPMNKTVYEVTALPMLQFYNFEANTNASSTITGADDVQVIGQGSAFQLNTPSGTTFSAIAYLGTGPMANYLTVPAANRFEANSSTAKSFALTGSGASAANYPLALNDVYCVKMYTGGYAWLQITNVGTFSSVGPSFVFRVNTTQQYCAYEQTTADKEIVNVLSVFSLANATPSTGLAVSPLSGAATILYANYKNASNSWIQGFNSSATPVATVAGGAANYVGNGLAISSNGATIVRSSTTPGVMLGYATGGAPTSFYVGSSANVQSAFGSYSSSYGDAWVYPYGVAADSNSNIYGTDVVGNSNCNFNVMSFITPSYTPTEWALGTSLSCTPYGIAVTVSGGVTYTYVADTGNNDIVFFNAYSGGGTTPVATWNYDKVTTGTNFVSPSGIALNGNGRLFIASINSTFSVVEWNISSLASTPSFVAEWEPVLSASYGSFSFGTQPIGIAVDNATPPNVFVNDYGNSRIIEFKGQ